MGIYIVELLNQTQALNHALQNKFWRFLDGFKVNCLMNARYHATREAFLDGVHRWFMFGVVALGAGAVATFTQGIAGLNWLDSAMAALAAVLGALDLTFDLSNRARAHALMKRRYFELLADVADERRDLRDAEACLHRYAADEEPAYHAIICISWNAAQEMVYGDEAYQFSIPWHHRIFQNFWRFGGVKYNVVKPAPEGSIGSGKQNITTTP